MRDRLYVIDLDGKVVFNGGRGPFGFKPIEMEQSVFTLLLDTMGHKPGLFHRLVAEFVRSRAVAASYGQNSHVLRTLRRVSRGR